MREVLAGAHQVEVVVGNEPEETERLVEKIAVLRGRDEDRREAGIGGERLVDGRELDGLRAGTEADEDTSGHV